MSTIVTLILGKLLDYLAANADKIVEEIKKEFKISETDPSVRDAIQELGYNPTEEALTKLHDVLKEKGEDTGKLAAILINKTTVPV